MEVASTAKLFQTPCHPYTKALLSAALIPDPLIESQRSRIVLKGELPSPFNSPRGCPFHTRCPHAQWSCQQMPLEWQERGQGHFTACPF
jgi:oligopeptide transport system ATP-binding protein